MATINPAGYYNISIPSEYYDAILQSAASQLANLDYSSYANSLGGVGGVIPQKTKQLIEKEAVEQLNREDRRKTLELLKELEKKV